MRLRLILEVNLKNNPSEDELFNMAIKNAKPSPLINLTFYELPQAVQDAYLKKYSYESIKNAFIIPAGVGELSNPMYVIRNREWIEHPFWEDGAEVIHEPEDENLTDHEDHADMIDRQMEQHYGKPEDYDI